MHLCQEQLLLRPFQSKKQGAEKPLSDTQGQFFSKTTQSELPDALAERNKPNSYLKQRAQILYQAVQIKNKAMHLDRCVQSSLRKIFISNLVLIVISMIHTFLPAFCQNRFTIKINQLGCNLPPCASCKTCIPIMHHFPTNCPHAESKASILFFVLFIYFERKLTWFLSSIQTVQSCPSSPIQGRVLLKLEVEEIWDNMTIVFL